MSQSPMPPTQAAAPASPGAALAPRTAPIALVAAVRDELWPTIRRLGLQPDQPWHVGAAGDRRIVAAFTGVGRQRAVEVFTTMLEEHQPGHVVHLGFAGGMDPALGAGEVLDIDCVMDGSGAAVRLAGGRAVLAAGTPGPGAGRTLLTVDHLIHSVEVKQELYARHRAAAVDMETFYIARIAAERGLRLSVLRAISDPADMAIPDQAAGWINPDGTDNVPKALWGLLRRPWQIPMTMRLGRHVRRAGENLADRVERLLREL